MIRPIHGCIADKWILYHAILQNLTFATLNIAGFTKLFQSKVGQTATRYIDLYIHELFFKVFLSGIMYQSNDVSLSINCDNSSTDGNQVVHICEIAIIKSHHVRL